MSSKEEEEYLHRRLLPGHNTNLSFPPRRLTVTSPVFASIILYIHVRSYYKWTPIIHTETLSVSKLEVTSTIFPFSNLPLYFDINFVSTTLFFSYKIKYSYTRSSKHLCKSSASLWQFFTCCNFIAWRSLKNILIKKVTREKRRILVMRDEGSQYQSVKWILSISFLSFSKVWNKLFFNLNAFLNIIQKFKVVPVFLRFHKFCWIEVLFRTKTFRDCWRFFLDVTRVILEFDLMLKSLYKILSVADIPWITEKSLLWLNSCNTQVVSFTWYIFI